MIEEAGRVVPAACDAGFATFLFFRLLFVFFRFESCFAGFFLSEFLSRPGLPIDEARSTAFMA